MAHRIVLVDDNERTRAAVRRLLERHGLRVREAARDSDVAQDDQADVVIVDERHARSAAPAEPPDRERATQISGGRTDEWSWRDDHSAYERQREELGERYAGRFIAMHCGAVIGVGETAEDAAREGLTRLRQPAALFVVRAGDPLPEPEELDMHMDAPRSVLWEQ